MSRSSRWLAAAAAVLVGSPLDASAADFADPDRGCGHVVERSTVTSRWRVAETTLLEVGGLPPGAEVNVEVKLVFGALWTQWVEGPFVADASGALTWAPALDREAYLHPLASDFVTDLAVRLEVVSGTSRELVSADPAVVAFPDGQRGDPVVWDLATMNDRAPRGVLSPSLRALLGDGTGRARPPVPYAVRPPVEPVQQEDDR